MTAHKKQVSWDINSSCDYHCSYCSLHGKSPGPAAPETLYLSPEEWGACWDRFHASYGPARIHIAGGEPFLYPGFTELLRRLSVKHELYVITNFSKDLSGLAGLVSPDSVRLVLSLHPEHVPAPEEFLRRAVSLQAAGFRVRVTAVAYPPFITAVLDHGRRCRALGLKFVGTPFFGGWQGGQYPLAYTEAEKRALSVLLDRPGDARYQFQEVDPRGRECRAGEDYCRIGPDGKVKACLNGAAMGNFTSPGFRLMERPAACPSDHCHCMLEFAHCGGEDEGSPGPDKC